MVTPSCDRMKPSRDVCTPALCRIKTSKKVDDRVFSSLDECTRETADTCIQKQPRMSCRDRARPRVRMKEREARGASMIPDGRISHVKTASPAARDDRSHRRIE
jgi:hypothetical protein